MADVRCEVEWVAPQIVPDGRAGSVQMMCDRKVLRIELLYECV